MVASGKIRCQVIAIPVSTEFADSRFSSLIDVNETRPSELVPWADPYIAGLVNKLQREVRNERKVERQVEWNPIEVLSDRDISLYGRQLADYELDAADVFAPPSAEAEWPWFNEDFDSDGLDNDRVQDWEDGSGDVPAFN